MTDQIEAWIADAIAGGTDHVRAVRIPSNVAQECARRWLLAEAARAERAKARDVEQAARKAKRVEQERKWELGADARKDATARRDEYALARYRQRMAERDKRLADALDEIIEARAADAGMEWTAPLLTTTVALPDGSRVPWGEATIEQHEARIAMLAKHAAGELETAARHRAAIDAINAAGVRCLNDLEAVAA